MGEELKDDSNLADSGVFPALDEATKKEYEEFLAKNKEYNDLRGLSSRDDDKQKRFEDLSIELGRKYQKKKSS